MKIQKRRKKHKAYFITLEGPEASGKSSIIAFLKKYLTKQGLTVRVFREPGSTKIGERIRTLLLDKRNRNLSPHTELLLYLAARTQLIEEKLHDAFKRYDVVICDRFFDSTLVYQGYGLGLGEIVERGVMLFSLGVVPDATLVLDTDIKESLKRLRNKDRIESRMLSFHYRLKSGYRRLAQKYPRRITLIRADRPLDAVCLAAQRVVERVIWKKRKKK